MYERPDKQDLVLSFRRKVRFRYVISPEGRGDFSDPDAANGVGEFLLDGEYLAISTNQINNDAFKQFVELACLGFRVNQDKLTLHNFDPPIFYKSLPSASEKFESIAGVRAASPRSSVCPPIQEGDIILIDAVKACGYTLKILFEQVRTLKPSELSPPPKAQPTTLGISYEDFPPHLQTILDIGTLDVQAHGGACIAGKARLGDGAPVSSGKDIMINLYYRGDIPLHIYEGGWFVTDGTLNSYHSGPDRPFVLRAFGYDPIDASITILDKEITYVGFEMKKTPPDKLSSVKGVVMDEHDRPLEGAYVRISFPFAYSRSRPEMTIHTDAGGEYLFKGLSGGEHELLSSKAGYASDWDKFTPSEGATAVIDLRLYPRHRIVIDYVYQADGSRNFTSGNLHTGTIDWGLYEGSVDFSDGKLQRPGPGEDLRLYQEKGRLYFRIFHAGGPNGFYDAGVVPLDSVTEAADKGYTTQGNRPCKVGHVYVVRTREEDSYAKFIVKSLEAF
jgi:hypothetical protein